MSDIAHPLGLLSPQEADRHMPNLNLIVVAYSQADPGPPGFDIEPDPAAPVLIVVPPPRPTRQRQPQAGGRLTDATARRAKEMLVAGVSKAAVARELGTSRAVIYSLAHGQRWDHVPWPVGWSHCAPGSAKLTRLPAEMVD
jgi:hypothetical protein